MPSNTGPNSDDQFRQTESTTQGPPPAEEYEFEPLENLTIQIPSSDVLFRAVEKALSGPFSEELTEAILNSPSLAESIPNVIYYPTLVEMLIQNIRNGGHPNRDTGRSSHKARAEKFIVIFSDLDGTLIPTRFYDEKISERSARALIEIDQICKEYNIALIPITGSQLQTGSSVSDSLEKKLDGGEIPSCFPLIVSSGGKTASGLDIHRNFQLDPFYNSYVNIFEEKFPQRTLARQCDDYLTTINSGNMDSRLGIGKVPLDRDFIREIDPALHNTDPSTPLQRIFYQPHRTPSSPDQTGLHLYFYASSLEERDILETYFRDEFERKDRAVVCCVERHYDDNLRANILAGRVAGDLDSVPRKYCLDVTPYDKSTAITYFSNLIKKTKEGLLGIGLGHGLPSDYFEREFEYWFCCDSANDLPAARHDAISRVVMVGGSTAELTRHADSLIESGKEVSFEGDRWIAAESILKDLQSRLGLPSTL